MEMSLTSVNMCETGTGGIPREKYDILLSIFEDWAAENPSPNVVVSILKSFAKSSDQKLCIKNQESSTKVEENEEVEAPAVIKLEDKEDGVEENDERNPDTNNDNNSESQSEHHEPNEENNLLPITTTEDASQDHEAQSTSSSLINFNHETESQVGENKSVEHNQIKGSNKRILRSDLHKTISSRETGSVLEKKYKSSWSTDSETVDSPPTLFRNKMRIRKVAQSSPSTKQRFSCSYCQCTYASKSGLVRHQRFSCPSSLPECNQMTTLTRRLKTERNWW